MEAVSLYNPYLDFVTWLGPTALGPGLPDPACAAPGLLGHNSNFLQFLF